MAIPGELIPLAGIAIAGIAVIGRVIVQPVIAAVMKLAEQKNSPAALPDVSRLEQRLTLLEDRLGGMERSMDRLIADRDFYLQLQAGKTPPQP